MLEILELFGLGPFLFLFGDPSRRKISPKEEAMSYLRCYRGANHHSKDVGDDIRAQLALGGLSLRDIGTDEAEMKVLKTRLARLKALRDLGYLRSPGGCEFYESFEAGMRGYLSEVGLDLRDIGTNEVEIEELRKKGIMAKALATLEWLRRDRDFCGGSVVEGLKCQLAKLGLSLEDIGTSDAELAALQAMGVNMWETFYKYL